MSLFGFSLVETDTLNRIEVKLVKLLEGQKLIMATQKDEVTLLNSIATEVGGIGDGIDALETALANAGNTTPEVDAALADLQAKVDSVQAKLPAQTTSTSPPAA